MSKKSIIPDATTFDSIIVTDDPACFEALRDFGLTVTQDVNPGLVLTFDKPERVFVGDRVVRDAPGKFHVEKAANA